MTNPEMPSVVLRSRDAASHGLTRHDLGRPWWEAPTRGVRVPTGSVDGVAARCRAALEILPSSAAFSHVTALRLLGIEVPWRLDPRLRRDRRGARAPARRRPASGPAAAA